MGVGVTPLPEGLLDWVAEVVGAPVSRAREHPASGRSRLIWLVEAGGRRLLVRQETGLGPFAGTEFTLAREASVLRSLAGSSVPVPAVHGVSDDGGTVLMEELPGTADLDLSTPDGHEALVAFCRTLAELHRLDPAGVPLPLPGDPAEHTLLDLEAHRRSYSLGEPNPVAERALGLLTEHAPAAPVRTSVLHGDAGPGNFLHDGGRVTGLIDWEMAHAGDPHDDLAWLWFRITVLRSGCSTPDADPSAALALAYRAYRDASGLDPDPGRIDHYCLLVLVRCLIATLTRQRNNPGHPAEPVERMTRLVALALDNHARTGRVTGSGPLAPLPAP